MSLIFKRDNSSPFPEPIVPPWPGAFGGGMAQADAALRIDSVWACVRLLSDTVSMLPLTPLDERGGVEVPLPMRRWPQLLVEPSPGLTMSDWLRQMMISLLLRGNAYAEWTGNALEGGQLRPLNPDIVTVRVEGGEKVIRVNGDIKSNVFHVARWVLPGDVVGMSPIKYNSTLLQTQMLIDDFARGYFQDAPHPAHLFSTDKPVNQQQAKEIKDRIQANVGSREPLVVGLGLKHETLSISPEESQFLQTQQMSVGRIARIFGVPPEMIGGGVSGQSVTYANVTQRAVDFLTFGVQPWLGLFEQAISRVLYRRQHVRFDTRELVRMTPVDQANVTKTELTTGERFINEVRRERGLEDVPWGNEPYLPGMSPAAAGAVASEAATAGEGEK